MGSQRPQLTLDNILFGQPQHDTCQFQRPRAAGKRSRRGGRVASISHFFRPDLSATRCRPRDDPDAENRFTSGPYAQRRKFMVRRPNISLPAGFYSVNSRIPTKSFRLVFPTNQIGHRRPIFFHRPSGDTAGCC
jgi:hypothetical protein